MFSILKETLSHHYNLNECIDSDVRNMPNDILDAIKLWILCNVHTEPNRYTCEYTILALQQMIHDDTGILVSFDVIYKLMKALSLTPIGRSDDLMTFEFHKKYKFDSTRIGKSIWISKIVRLFIDQLYNIYNAPTIKNIFIAQQMFCLSDSEVRIARNTIKYFAKKKYGDDVNFIDQYNVPDDELAPSDTKQPRLHYLGRSIKMLSNADLVIFHGNAKTEFTGGCAIEKHICEEYDIPYIYSEELFYNGGDI